MIWEVRNTWVTTVFIIYVIGALMQAGTGDAISSYQRYSRRHISKPPCINAISSDDENFNDFEAKIRGTEFVFTGKVTAEIPSVGNSGSLRRNGETEDGASKFTVRVKRVLKGELPLQFDIGDELMNAKQMNVKIRTMDKPKAQQNCYKRPLRVHHTAIFLAKKVEESVLQLTSDPLPLTLHNLDKVNAAVKDMTYKPRPPIVEEPCEKTNCAYGADCVQTADGRMECQCPTMCPSTFTPVCGTDGVTYSNRCMMLMTSCRQETKTRVQHSGECDPRSPKRRHRGGTPRRYRTQGTDNLSV